MPWQDRQARAFVTALATSRVFPSARADSEALPTDDTTVMLPSTPDMAKPVWMTPAQP
jgi:hypothetical protein